MVSLTVELPVEHTPLIRPNETEAVHLLLAGIAQVLGEATVLPEFRSVAVDFASGRSLVAIGIKSAERLTGHPA
jgi:hypothetical protein